MATDPVVTEGAPSSLTHDTIAAKQEWRCGWPVVMAGLFGFMIASLGLVTIGAFMVPVQAEFGWSRSEFSSGLSLPALIGVPLPPLIGALVDRYGARIVAGFGALVVGAAFAAFGTATGTLANWYLLWTSYALAAQLVTPTIWSAAIATTFTVHRGFAMSIAMMGSGMAAFVLPITANLLIERYGFRAAYVSLGVGAGLLMAIVSWLAMPRKATKLASKERSSPPAPLAGLRLRDGLRSGTFAKFAIMLFVTQMAAYAVFVHLIPLLSGVGLSRDAAVILAGVYGLAMIVGKIGAGLAIDRFPAQLVLAGLIVAMAASFAMLTPPLTTLRWAIVAVTIFGFAFGGMSPIFPYLVSRHFGLRSFGRLYGGLSCLSGVAYGTGPLFAGLIFDRTGSYLPLLIGSLPLLLLAATLSATLSRYPDFAAKSDRG